MITFNAEVTQVIIKKTISLDKEIKVVIITSEEKALMLQAFIADKPVKITIQDYE